jgi:hypothetical protein
MQRIYVTFGMLALLALFLVGCGLTSKLAEPPLSENFAPKGTSDVPELVDGSMYTTAKALQPEYVKGQEQNASRFSEVTITLKEKKDIKKVVVRRRQEDAVAVDMDLEAMVDGNWKKIKEVRGEVKPDIVAMANVITDKIKVKVQRATRTADGKSAISATAKQGGGGSRRGPEVDRILFEPVKLAEIELYSFKTKEAVK